MATDSYLIELAAELYAVRDRAVPLRYTRRVARGFEAHPHDCHTNADRWVQLHPADTVVRGWFVLHLPLSSRPMTRFQAHSVVAGSSGRLLDITPREPTIPLPFLAHPDGNAMFDLIVSKHRIISLTHRMP
ncbi:hypothetical protein [Hyphomicrobium sp. DY-1]|uniref:hypothetical protein n=1 Tax=Hyphomicrobium sp. DY-1 TaxID=3075650 RepID=UPI0039C1287F